MSGPACHLFVGPSGAGLREVEAPDPRLIVHPPIKRGDLPTLRASGPPGVIAIADGLFHAEPAVGHNELLLALRDGWTIYGLCSMGALRACEMRAYGMIPFGRVARRYADAPDTPDDFVALLHGPAPDYVALSEPYIHLEALLDRARDEELLPEAEGSRIRAALTQCWYGYRTLDRFTALVTEAAPEGSCREGMSALLERFDDFRIKQHDLSAFLNERPWERATGERRSG